MNVNSRKKSISTILILAIVLLVPGFLYILLHRIGTNEYLKLPIYGEKVLSGKMNRKMGREIPDTLYHQVEAIRFLTNKGDSVPLLRDTTISVVHLMYTSDSTLSVVLAKKLQPIVERFKNNHSVKFYSISVNPLDTEKQLSGFASKLGKGLTDNWYFVGNGNIDLLTFARKDLLIDAMVDPNDSTQFLISNNYVLLDSKGRIRGFYDINLKTEVDRLQDEIKVQLIEEIRNNPFKVEKK